MKLLILGGTVFLGRHVAEQALERGHEVTLFHRGQHGNDLFPQAEHVHGDRNESLAALTRDGAGRGLPPEGGGAVVHDAAGPGDRPARDGVSRSWDAVIDTSAYFPRQVRMAAEALAGRTRHYLLISTISVYASTAPPGPDEDSPLGTLDDESTEEVTGETYGPLKALCEKAALEGFGAERTAIVRPGLIVGPWDPTDRFTYWPRRLAEGGDVLAPGNPEQTTQFIDVRDLAAWCLDLAESRRTGTFNATGPAEPLSMRSFLERAREALGSEARLVWADEAFIEEQGIAPWMELTCWVPAAQSGMMNAAISRALAAGLRLRPLEETVRDTLAWERTQPADRERRAGLARDKERAAMAALGERPGPAQGT